MHRVPFRDPSLNEELSERLLSGRVAADDVPHAYRGLAALFETATAAPTADEMAHKATVVAAAVAAIGGAETVHSLAPDQLSRRRSMLSKILTAKVAAAATVAALGLGTAAAAMAGALPTQANSHATVNLTTSGSGSTGGNDSNTNNQGQGSSHTPNAVTNTNAEFGLCTALINHHASQTTPSAVPSDSSKVFSAFITEHGGTGTTSLSNALAYCKNYVAAHHPGTDNTDTNSGGKPDNAGSSNSKAPVPTPNTGAGTGDTASNGANSTGDNTAGGASHGASTSGSGNAGGH